MALANPVRILLGALLVCGAGAGVACSSSGTATAVVNDDDGGFDAGTSNDSATGDAAPSDAVLQAKAVQAMHDVLLVDIQTLAASAVEMQNEAPTPTGRGWDKTLDASAITAMRASWQKARTAYEHIEGALAPLFPDIDVSIDARYDDFLATLASKGGDAYLFDDQGVTGMHAVERILFTDNVPQRVVDFEQSLVGYVPAAIPATEMEAADFKNKLLGKLIADIKVLVSQWTPAMINVQIAYRGLVALVQEQKEKIQKASTGEEESRYSQRTMADIRDNLVGTKTVYSIFQPWIVTKPGSATIDQKVKNGFASLDAAYALVSADSVPTPPATWSAESPSAADLMTPFGQLYTSVLDQSDLTKPDSIAAQLDTAGVLLGFPPN